MKKLFNNKTPTILTQLSFFRLFFAFTILYFGCTAPEDDQPIQTSTDDITPEDSDTEGQRSPVDGLSGATPGAKDILLTTSHQGFGQSNCQSCHGTVHRDGFEPGDCVVCHGNNGAPNRPDGHDDMGCEDCHQEVHQESKFDSPNQCRACHNYPEHGECAYEEEYDVVIIGAGGGGLASAAKLSLAGKKVVVIEKHFKTGGAMVNFKRDDYRFEASLHGYDGMGMGFFDELEIADKIEPVRAEHVYRAIFPDFSLDVSGDPEVYRETLKQKFPAEADNIDRLLGDMMTFDLAMFFGMSVTEMLAKYDITDPKLISVITQLAGYAAGGPDKLSAAVFAGMWVSYHVLGFYYFVGGSESITQALTKTVTDNGGIIKTYTSAEKIVIEKGMGKMVRTDDGGCYKAPHFISNSNGPETYFNLIGEEYLPADMAADYKSRKFAPPITVFYLGVDHDYTGYFAKGGHELFINRHYDLATTKFQEETLCEPIRQSFHISNYSVADPTAAPPGKNVIAILSGVGYECNEEWMYSQSYKSYNEYKKELAQFYIEEAEKYLPGLSEHIEVLEVASPLTVEQYTRNPGGTWSGWDTMYVENPIDIYNQNSHRTPIPNILIAGSWAANGGQSIALGSGLVAAKMILEEQ